MRISCMRLCRCNQYKGALLPEATALAQEQRLLHPLRDDLGPPIYGKKVLLPQPCWYSGR